MTQDEFILKLFSLYSTTFSKGNGQAWTDAYKQVLKPNINYDKLYEFMLANYAGTSAPSPAFLLKNAVFIKTQEVEQPEEYDTIIVRKGKYDYEYGVKLSNYINDIKYFDKEGMNIIRLKFCNTTECQRCNYNHVCLTAKEKRA